MSLISPLQAVSSAPLPNLMEASGLALNMSNQLGYIARDAIRVQTVPDHRKADTLARNFVPAFMIPLIMESAFRVVDTYYTIPLLSQTLKLKELGYKTMPEVLRGRMVSRLVTPGSAFVVPRVLQNIELPKAVGDKERNELKQLAEHLQKKLCPTDYLENLVQSKQLSQIDLDRVKDMSSEILKDFNVKELFNNGITTYNKSVLDEKLAKMSSQHLGQHSLEQREKLLGHIRMCVDSKFTQEMVKRIQKTATWQNMFLATFMSFIFYGLMANLFEVKVVRPWQKRLVEQRGSSKEVVAPCYLATIPWLLTVFVGLGNKAPRFLQKMSHLNRFLTVSGVAFGSYLITAALLIKKKLSSPPPSQVSKERQAATSFQGQGGSTNKSSLPSYATSPQQTSATGNNHASFGFNAFSMPQTYALPFLQQGITLPANVFQFAQKPMVSHYEPLPQNSPFQQQSNALPLSHNVNPIPLIQQDARAKEIPLSVNQ
jgi:hypothetical protein